MRIVWFLIEKLGCCWRGFSSMCRWWAAYPYGLMSVYLVVPLGLGLLISSASATQQQALFVAFFFLIIFILLCGLFTPTEYMPEWAWALDVINPLLYIIDIVRRILLKGSTLRDILRPVLALLGMALAVNTLAVWRYRKTSG